MGLSQIESAAPFLQAANRFHTVKEAGRTMYQIGELSELTGVQAGTIRFYEKCGFLETVERLPNRYRLYNGHHVYQVRVCRLVFGGFVNRRLRRASLKIIEAAKNWDLAAYEAAARNYLKEIQEESEETQKVIRFALAYAKGKEEPEPPGVFYTKKQAAELLGVTGESIRNWDRNGLLPLQQPYQKRLYPQAAVNRMYLIRLLLDTGYSIMTISRFLQNMDSGEYANAEKLLIKPEEGEDLQSRADCYLQALSELRQKAEALYGMLAEMKK